MPTQEELETFAKEVPAYICDETVLQLPLITPPEDQIKIETVSEELTGLDACEAALRQQTLRVDRSETMQGLRGFQSSMIRRPAMICVLLPRR